MSLTSKQKSYLKALAHHLEPVVRVGRAGATDAVSGEVERTVDAHELIKIRIEVEDSSERRAIAADLAQRTGAEFVGAVGKIAILYRARAEKPKIKLP
jgi:RNA-binding protein